MDAGANDNGDNGIDAGVAPGNAAANDAPDAPDAGGNADVGILNADNASSGEDEEGAPTDLLDVYEALNSATLTGSFCSADIADGSTLTPALPFSPGLRITGVGDVPFPLSEFHARAIKSDSHTAKVEDESFHKVYSVESRRIRINNPAWEAKFASLLHTVAYRLGVDPDKLSAKLDTLLLMEKGSRVKRCSNDEEDENVMGTLLVQLPSTFKGGKMSIFNVEEKDGDEEEEEDEDEEEQEEVMTFDMGAASGEAPFACHFVAHYKDCEYEIGKVTSGRRALLRFSLRYDGGPEMPTANALVSSLSALKWSLSELPPSDRVLLIPLAKKYRSSTIGRLGINALSHYHRSRVEAIKVSAGEGWRVLIVNAKLAHTRKTDYYGATVFSNGKGSVMDIFDEKGYDVTAEEGWLKSVVNLTPLDVGEGMVLNVDREGYEEDWGCVKSSSSTSRYYGGEKTNSQYQSTFILAYDATLADAELQCLRGSAGVAEVTDKVVAARNYPMLERMLAVVESKANAKFNVSSCTKVLQMLNRARSKNSTSSERIEFARKTISGLGSSEPDTELYDAIRAAADKFGYENINAQVSDLLSNADRRKDLELNLFLRRCDFILKLSRGHENDWLATLCQRLPHFGAGRIADSGIINSSIDSLISEHGWEAVSLVVKAALHFMHSKNTHNKAVGVLLDRARLLQKISDHPNDFVQSCLVDFAEDFAYGLASCSAFASKQQLRGDNKQLFVKAICNVIELGADTDFDRLGRWSICDKELFTLVLDVIVEQAGDLGFDSQSLIHEVFNRCLVQNSISPHRGWPREDNGTTTKSLHVRKIIEMYPNMTRTPGRDGRLTLHCAVASKATPYDTIVEVFESYPRAASIRCPVSGLYPFMLAASNSQDAVGIGRARVGHGRVRSDLLGASFLLLLADPSQVAGGVPVDDGESSRKRKRSASMDGHDS